ncbi:GTPase ObgE [Gehongia tenuis]|uniref:GTPase Obg n=1 Tax=Gehongia tenuis TaxID=2763655 RepID=A0A926D6P9_9FIRM|nr:GTPase ObgE [Gehongia tenuis]MBC8532389.1 GTPase ObgE [Gehongia tenuis]
MFVDRADITIKAGNGGNGCVSFHREKYVANGGPDGGDGGKGGDVVFVASDHLRTLMDFRYKRKFTAGNGEDGKSDNRTGKNGLDLIVEVPVGTLVRDESGRILADMNEDGKRRVVMVGGKGGRGNARFATATRQAPRFAQEGEKVGERRVELELKSIADVGLVGFPNVGKSTLLSRTTKARPKIANYHFTTLTPNLGVVSLEGHESFVMADIPGLIEGAAEGAGLGHDFLRHVERTRMLIHVLDISGCEGRDPLEDYDQIMSELREYSEKLAARPKIVAANKTDLPDSEENLKRLKEKLEPEDVPVYAISAATGAGVNELMWAAVRMLREIPVDEESFAEAEDLLEAKVDQRAYEINRDSAGTYIVEGPLAEALMRRVNFEDSESLRYFQRVLIQRGVIDALRKAGAKDGDSVRVDELEFDFME